MITRHLLPFLNLLLFFLYYTASAQEAPPGEETTPYELFQPGVISLPDISEGSPSITADGNTLVFVRYQNYGKKVPYIAHGGGDSWEVERLPFVDTLYNLAISPDGRDIFYKVRYLSDGSGAQSFRVRRQADGSWGEPSPLPGPLFKNAGYFRVATDGTLYMYINAAAGNARGIYFSEPRPDGSYGPPQWLSDAVSPYGTTTFSPLVNRDETKIIVTRAGLMADTAKQRLGPRGLYFHQKHNGQWDTGVRVEPLPYSWYAEILPDDRLLFRYEGDLYTIPLAEMNIAMTGSSRQDKILARLKAMEAAYTAGELERIPSFYSPRGYMVEDGEVVARARWQITEYWTETPAEPVGWRLTSYLITPEPADIYDLQVWKGLEDKPVPPADLDIRLPENGLYQFGRSELVYKVDGEQRTSVVHFLLYWTEEWGEAKIFLDSY